MISSIMKYINSVLLLVVVWCLFKDNFVQCSLQEKKNNAAEVQEAKLFQPDDLVLPKIYNVDETETCPENHNYCKMNIKLFPVDPVNTSLLWKAIEKVNNEDKVRYRRDLIYRAFCVGFNDSQERYKEYINEGVDGYVVDSYCIKEKNLFELLDIIDIIFLFSTICYCSLVIYCTTKKTNSSDSVFIGIFSMKIAWKDLQKPIRNEDYNNLLFIQGLRTLLSIYVILGHNFFFLMVLFSHNPEYIENFYFDPLKRLLTGSFGLTIQVFFVISSWVHAINLYNVAKMKKSFSMRDALVITLNRYFRIMPLMIITMLAQRSGLANYVLKPLHQSLYIDEISKCMNGWWKNFLLIQNLSTFGGQSCLPHSWSVAADTQLFVLSTMAFYLSRRFNISLKYFAAAAISAAVSTQAYTILSNGYGGLFQFFPSVLPLENLFVSPEFLDIYYSTMNQTSSYVIGFSFGIIYMEHKKKRIFDTTMRKLAWLIAFFILPISSFFLHSLIYSKPLEFLMALTLRPIFAFGIAVGFLGLATNTGGIIRNVLQSKPLVFLANFNYSVYVFHVMVLFLRFGNITKMVVLSNTFYLVNLTADIIGSFVLGILFYFLFEHPFYKLQKRLLPQLEAAKKKL